MDSPQLFRVSTVYDWDTVAYSVGLCYKGKVLEYRFLDIGTSKTSITLINCRIAAWMSTLSPFPTPIIVHFSRLLCNCYFVSFCRSQLSQSRRNSSRSTRWHDNSPNGQFGESEVILPTSRVTLSVRSADNRLRRFFNYRMSTARASSL